MPSKKLPAKPADTSIVPAYVAAAPAMGFEELDERDFLLPRLAVCQSMSPQRQRSHELYIEGLQEGDFFNTLTGTKIEPPLAVVPLYLSKSRIKFFPLDAGGGIDCSAPDGKTGGHYASSCEACKHSQWGGEDGRPSCMLFLNVPVLLWPSEEIIVMSFKSASMKVGKRWASIMRQRGGPAWASRYELSTTAVKNSKGTFYVPTVRPVDYMPEAFINRTQQLFENLRRRNVVIHVEEAAEDDAEL